MPISRRPPVSLRTMPVNVTTAPISPRPAVSCSTSRPASKASRCTRTAMGRPPVVTPGSKHPATTGDPAVGSEQHDGPGVVRKAQGENLRTELADLAGRKIHHRRHLPADKSVRDIVCGELRRALLDADLGAEVDLQLEGRLAR